MPARESIEQLRHRYRRSARAFAVLETIVPDVSFLLEAGIERVPIEQQLNAPGPLSAEALAALEGEVRAFERSFEQLDRKIPSRWFRKYCRVTPASAEGYADYCWLLAHHVSGPGDLARLDRVRVVFGRLAELVWPIAWSSREQRGRLAAEALPPSEVPAEVMCQVSAHLSAAAERLEGFTSVEQLLASDFIVEERGYVLALREKLLDPVILTASVELETAIEEAVQRLVRAEARDEEQLHEHLAEAQTRLEEIFSRLGIDESAAEKGFAAFQRRRAAWKRKQADRARAIERQERRRKEREQWEPKKRRWPTAVAIALLGLVVWARMPTAAVEQSLSVAEVAALSPLLEAASVGSGKKARVLLARLDATRWSELSPAARRTSANALAAVLVEQGLSNGTVFNGESIAVEIREGKVLVVR